MFRFYFEMPGTGVYPIYDRWEPSTLRGAVPIASSASAGVAQLIVDMLNEKSPAL